MDLIIILSLASGLAILVLFAFIFGRSSKALPQEQNEEERIPGRGAAGNRRARMRAAAAAQQQDGDEDETKGDLKLEKMGAKKRAKLEAKAEKKAMREAEERDMVDRKKKEELAAEERLKAQQKEAEDEKKREEEERLAREEQERREHEEYLKMKATFTLEEEGYDENECEDENALLQQFISYIMDNKVVVLEDLAATFRLKTQAVIDRINDLQASGRLTGVVDDRGKFIYISQKELEAVAKFVKQRGRVSITELAENSQTLINLTPNISVET